MADDIAAISKDIKRIVNALEMRKENLKNIDDKLNFKVQAKLNEKQEKLQEAEGKLQKEQSESTDKQTKFLKDSIKDWKKRKDEQWQIIKQNNILFKIGRAFWKSEAGKAIQNIFSRIKGIFNEILGEIGTFFMNLWGTLKDSFNFVKGTVGSVVDTLRGGDKKERREKKQAKDIEKIKEQLTKREKKELLKKAKAEKGKGLFSALGLQSLFSIGSIIAMIPSGVLGLGVAAIVASLGMALFKGIASYLAGNTAGQVIADAFKGFFTITRIAGSWIAKLVDLIFGTHIASWFEKQNWDAFFDKYLGESIDWIIDYIGGFIKRMIIFMGDALSGRLQNRFNDWLDETLPWWMGGKKDKDKTPEAFKGYEGPKGETPEQQAARSDAFYKKYESTLKGNEYYNKYLKNQNKKAEVQRDKTNETLDRINESLQKYGAGMPGAGIGIVSPPQQRGTQIQSPDINIQRGLQTQN